MKFVEKLLGKGGEFECQVGLLDENSEELKKVKRRIRKVARWIEANREDYFILYLERTTFVQYIIDPTGNPITSVLPSKIGAYAYFQCDEDEAKFEKKWVNGMDDPEFNPPIAGKLVDTIMILSNKYRFNNNPPMSVGEKFENIGLSFRSSGWSYSHWYEVDDESKRVATWLHDREIRDWTLKISTELPFEIRVSPNGKITETENSGAPVIELDFVHDADAVTFKLGWA